MSAPAPGVYRDVPYAEYAAWPAVRASTLNACARTMAHGRHAEVTGGKDSNDLDYGTAFHAAVLEPERFQQEWLVAPVCDRRTREGKETWAAFLEEAAGKNIMTGNDGEIAKAMIGSVYANQAAADLLAGAIVRELSVVWRDDATGLLCKARIDVLSRWEGWTTIVDLKSARDASRHGFSRAVVSYRYYASLAWYRRGLAAVSPADRRCMLIAVEKAPPFCTAVYELDEAALDKGDEEMADLLARYSEARASGVWSGYPGQPVEIGLPEWKIGIAA